ncbi:ATP-dependent helicase [Pelobacter propionicus]|uniref:DNA 3'-5' helicase n=1 Tax=Pelobacter propionicus (strain DSM 2379 / NBRC 103807 / OttBd1) TaxID=338966 RepID=A1AUN0_PELPD|nr:UvrD-helicase domain-containing protein [Pelobacter propionicus]ABL01051.1 ATP-dependent DNA helicase PcrA [Pelobacter propionicus DSM 2379]
MDFVKHLNQPQKSAVLHGEGPLLILAGAGSGKTRVITHRIAHLIHNHGVRPWNILAVTFTNKAAREMSERVSRLLGGGDAPLIATFHAACGRILRREIHHLGFDSSFAIYDERDCERLLKDLLKDMDLDDKKFSPRIVAARIDDYKNRGLFPHDLDPVATGDIFNAKVVQIYAAYQERLRKCNALDFGDMLIQTVRLLEQFPEVRQRCQERFQWIMVDEYQDTNPVQYRLIRLLAGERRNLCVVGDDDQSIYSWRGADIRNILEFEKDFPDVAVVRLEQNYRSTTTILKAAGAVVSRNIGRRGKTLWTENPEGEKIRYHRVESDREEARLVAREIVSLRSRGIPLEEMAVFYRTNAQSRLVEEALVSEALPYHIVGGVRFYARMEVKDILAYLRILDNPADEISLKRIINVPSRGIGGATIDRISQRVASSGASFYAAMAECAGSGLLGSGPRARVASFVDMMERFREMVALRGLPELCQTVMEESGYLARLRESRDQEDSERLENLEQLLAAMEEFCEKEPQAGLSAFLEQVSLVSDLEQGGQGKPSVTLMTLHAAKGLEFRAVFMIGMEERLFPHVRALDDLDGMEEERRLCYVGMTRARERLYLLNTRRRYLFGQEQCNPPSRFLKDIPAGLLDDGGEPSQPGLGFRSAAEQAGRNGQEPSTGIIAMGHSGRREKTVARHDGGHNLAQVVSACDEIEVIPEPPEEHDGVFIGMKVRHGTFGQGTIRKLEGSGESQKVIVWFNSVGPKKLMLRFAGLERA